MDPDSAAGLAVRVMANELIDKNHEDLRQARIAFAWALSWKPDVDGRLQVGKCKVANDLDRELADFDLVIILLREFWDGEETKEKHRLALLDHQLSHGALQRAKNLEPIEDEKGRKCYRIRKHDVEEFSAVVQRHGIYQKELEQFARAVLAGRQRDLFEAGAAEGIVADAGNFPRAVATAGADAGAEVAGEEVKSNGS